MMTKRTLLVLMFLVLGRDLLVPASPVPTSQLLSQNFSQGTSDPVTSTNSSSAQPHPGPRPGSRITLSLDVPVGLLQILLEQDRARATREQAVANAHILAHVGRR